MNIHREKVKMTNKVLSISIAAYNVENYIKETLMSLVVKKNLDKLEILIIDDGSTDGTAKAAQEFVKKYPCSFFYFYKPNAGHGSTINFALTKATGKYFKVLDGDDKLLTDSLDDFIDYLCIVDCDLVLSEQIIIDISKNNRIYPRIKGVEPLKTQSTNNLSFVSSCLLPNITVRTDNYRIKKLTVSERCFYDDLEWNYNCISSAKDLVYWNRELYVYIIGRAGQSVSLASRQKNYKMLQNITIKLNNKFVNESHSMNMFQKESIKNMIADALYGTYVIYLSFTDTCNYEAELESFVNIIDVNIKRYCKNKYTLFSVYCFSKKWYKILALYYRWKKGIKNEKN